MKNIIDHYYDGNNFLGYLCETENGLLFGYDAHLDEPRYCTYEFEYFYEFMEYLKRNYRQYR